MKKEPILLFLLGEYADWEAAYLSTAIYSMARDRFEIRTVSLTKEPFCSAGGLRVLPDHSLDTMPEEYAALILVGGYRWRKENLERLRPVVERCLDRKKPLGAICDATVYLGSIGALNTVRHTSNSLEGLRAYAGAAYTGGELYQNCLAVRGENIVTANGTGTLEFAKEMLLYLNAAPKEKIEQWYLFHRLGYHAVPESQF